MTDMLSLFTSEGTVPCFTLPYLTPFFSATKCFRLCYHMSLDLHGSAVYVSQEECNSYILLPQVFPISNPSNHILHTHPLTFRLTVGLLSSDITAMPELHHIRLSAFCGGYKRRIPDG